MVVPLPAMLATAVALSALIAVLPPACAFRALLLTTPVTAFRAKTPVAPVLGTIPSVASVMVPEPVAVLLWLL